MEDLMREMSKLVRDIVHETLEGGGFMGEAVHGSGNVVTEQRQVSDFDEVALRGIGNLYLKQGDEESLTIEAEDNIIPAIRTEVHGRRLEIGHERGAWRNIRPTKPLNFYLTVKELHEVELSGSGSIEAEMLRTDSLTVSISGSGDARIEQIEGDELATRISGSGSLRAAGRVTRQTITISGSGDYRADDLVTETCSVTVSGSGHADLRVAEKLDVVISGAGSIRYIGSPSIHKVVSGSGRIRQQSA